jgi:protein gp37
MGQTTGISWCDHTANFWTGCTKVSDGCKHCYAETFTTNRMGLHVWGPTAERRPAKAIWSDILKWQREAAQEGVARKVFTSSMADFFEGPETCQDPAAYKVITGARERVFNDVIPKTPNLIYQILTKRPENIMRFVPPEWSDDWPANVWAGTSIEDQKTADKRIPLLLAVPAIVRFLSIEPLIGPVSLSPKSSAVAVLSRFHGPDGFDETGSQESFDRERWKIANVAWVIIGGESGPGARIMEREWADSLILQCSQAAIPCWFKQTGSVLAKQMGLRDVRHGGDIDEFPEALRVREFPA